MNKFLSWFKSLFATGLRRMPRGQRHPHAVVRIGQADYAIDYTPALESEHNDRRH